MKHEQIPAILGLIENEDLKKKLLELHSKIETSMRTNPASTRYHHSWLGGYSDHIAETMAIAVALYQMISEKKQLDFNLDDVVLISYVHDLDKLVRYQPTKEEWKRKKGQNWDTREGILGYDESAKVVQMCSKVGIIFEDKHLEALSHHHGGWSNNLSSVYSFGLQMSPFSTLIHCADLISGFIFGMKKNESPT